MPPATPSPPLPAGSPPALPGGASTLPSETREVELPSGHATLTHWSASDLLLTHARWRVTQPTPIPWPAPAAVVLLHVSLRGRTLIAHPHLPEPLSLAAHQHALLYCPQADARFHLDGLDAEAFTVQLPSAHFLSLAATLPEPLRAFAARVRAGQCAVLGPASLPLPMHHVIREVLACRLASSLQPLFLQAKAVELLALQAHAFIQQPAPPLRLSEYDRERIRFARDYLLQHAHLPPTLSELARIAGLNECKLKQGFKALFHLPPFAYLAEWRLTEARLQLLQGGRSATELAFDLGYSSLQHFSAAFKKRFGISPRELRT